MAHILSIETSTKVCSVALSNETGVLAYRELNEGRFSHAENLNVFIEEVMEEAQFDRKNLDAIAVSEGPGSYTGLRIGVSTAKGWCYGLNIPLIAVSTLRSMAYGLQQKGLKGWLIPMIDARRMEVFCAVFDDDLKPIRKVEAKVLDDSSFSELRGDKHFCGDGAGKFEELKGHEDEIHSVFPSARWIAPLAQEASKNKQFVDTAYFEPFYLKDFVAGTPKKPSYLG